MHCDLKKLPEKYVEFTKKICHALGEKGKTCFLPSRRSWVPCHCKVDTEGALEMFTPYSERVKLRKSFGKEDREAFNDAVWEEILDSKKVAKKSKSFKFHHKISTDGVCMSLLYSKPKPFSSRKTSSSSEEVSVLGKRKDPLVYSGRHVGLDPGKKNVVTTTDENGISLKYSCRQKNFESGLLRYRHVLQREKSKEASVLEAESLLSSCFSRSNDASQYKRYLSECASCEKVMNDFYGKEKWRGWKFRIYCKTRSSRDKLMNKMEKTYGKDCTIHYGDLSRRSQMKGCDPTPNGSLKEAIAKRFEVKDVDEFRTSKTCNACGFDLKSYKKKNGKRSHSRLLCETCGGKNSLTPAKRFVDRDLNAAHNILLAGMSSVRPEHLRRKRKLSSCGENVVEKKHRLEQNIDFRSTNVQSLLDEH